ncbi:23S rRNA (adenine(2503)-C(2))-methyltransferase RlmN [Haematospirillum jordaniae]|nr:23S rRNA (adenine(2503)-C(2))-methyltransferase RlmN [Haematospirillum jordaniae]NKD44846.1 23S rRNA (adenine(2503)-C(2))-methyltransferase RlmN [Haematospirillum jordaniae]NKD57037.1 23S rRNA (adenine(2503)-C(2))-methyltransferase RlmN [Haematospirillum jordaniae]NKD58807.1 23S rRNA (adenine(2503)-C(2))-methyltransferase RlmN [Haematospirillum jordaniae]NKD66962.1 23S rRNA (adenine(2503)-C(2))-methyltransferase RlmN [Haematospirillum jordaniae]NKD78809.1 23S rRNA (adenine(2503)-C(2))-methy
MKTPQVEIPVSAAGNIPNNPDHQGREDLIGLSREQLAERFALLGEKPFRVNQVWSWLYNRGIRDIDGMTNISRETRTKMQDVFHISRPSITSQQDSEDGTRKWLLKFGDRNEAETVYIPDRDRGSVCISTQVGCTLTCRFCHTGTQKLVRNLGAAEIVGQFLTARDSYGEWPTPNETGRLLSNVVVMGMGEPLFNYDNTVTALKILTDPDGIALSKRRVTLSTSGVVPRMYDLGRDVGVNLAVSLHAARDDIRDQIMPINKKWPLKDLIKACREYPAVSNARRITFEYVMLKGINDSDADARELARLVRGIPCKFNLIPFNKWPGSDLECSSWDRIERFADILCDLGYSAPVRRPRGRDILAACGQLKSESQRERLKRHQTTEAPPAA